MDLNTEVPMRQSLECFKLLDPKIILLSSSTKLRTRRESSLDLDIEFTKTMIQGLKLLRRY